MIFFNKCVIRSSCELHVRFCIYTHKPEFQFVFQQRKYLAILCLSRVTYGSAYQTVYSLISKKTMLLCLQIKTLFRQIMIFDMKRYSLKVPLAHKMSKSFGYAAVNFCMHTHRRARRRESYAKEIISCAA